MTANGLYDNIITYTKTKVYIKKYTLYINLYKEGVAVFSTEEIRDVFQIKKIYTAFYKKCDSRFFFEGETHNFWEIVIVLNGEIGITSGNGVFLLEKGQAILHAPMEFHRLWSEGGSFPEIIIFSFEAINVPEYSSKLFEVRNMEIPERVLAEVESAFVFDGGCVKEIKKSDCLDSQIALKDLEMFLLQTLSQRSVPKAPASTGTARNYNAIVTVLANNLDKSLAVADIAKMCGMSEINLKKTFSRYAGMGVMQYFNRMKIAEATRLLKSGRSVKEVSVSLGFSNQNYFSTVFKRITGNAPTHCLRNAESAEHRENIRNG